jgi:hypothetical protein
MKKPHVNLEERIDLAEKMRRVFAVHLLRWARQARLARIDRDRRDQALMFNKYELVGGPSGRRSRYLLRPRPLSGVLLRRRLPPEGRRPSPLPRARAAAAGSRMSATSDNPAKLSIADPRVVELEEQLAIAKTNSAGWEGIARGAARIIEIQRLAIRRLRTPSPN